MRRTIRICISLTPEELEMAHHRIAMISPGGGAHKLSGYIGKLIEYDRWQRALLPGERLRREGSGRIAAR